MDERSLNGDEIERQLAELAVRLRMLSPEQASLLSASPPRPDDRPGARFVAAGLLTEAQLDHLIAALRFKEKRVQDSRFGALAVDRGWARPEQITEALAEQKRLFLREGRSLLLGALLVQQKILTSQQCEALLADQGRARVQAPETAPAAAGEGVRVNVAPDHMAATLVINTDAARPSVDQLRALLAQHRVVHGIDEGVLAAIAAGETAADIGVVVAHGTPPTPPQNGTIEYLFDTHPLKAAKERGEGRIDYRDRGEIPQVSAGALLARRGASRPGNAGSDVLGRPIPPRPVKELPLRAGKGAALEPDRSSVRATVEGHPAVSPTGVISVFPEYRIEGDLDYSTGNVKFHGRVVVAGCVRAGFHVRCGELIAQEIEAAEVETEGDVTVNGGVIGATIHCGGTLRARYLHQGRVEALGDVMIEREVVDSQIAVSGALDAKQCTVMSSRISALGGVEAKEIGSESSTPCRIVVGIDEQAQQQIVRQQQEIESQEAKCAALEQAIADASTKREVIAKTIGPLAQEQDRALVRQRALQQERGAAAELEALSQQVHALATRLEELLSEQDRLQVQAATDDAALRVAHEELQVMHDDLAHLKAWAAERTGEFRVRAGMVHQQTVLKGPHVEARLNADCKAAVLVEREREDADGRTDWHIVRE